MKKLILLFFVFSSSLFADTLVQTKSGYYLLTQDANGIPTLTKTNITQIINLDDSTPTPPIPPATPDFKKTVIQQLNLINQAEPAKTNTRKALGQLYRTVAGLPVQNKDQLIQATDLLFNSLNLPAEWINWKKEIDKSVVGFSFDDAKKSWVIIADALENK